MRKTMTFLAALSLLLSAGSGLAQTRLSYGGLLAGGGTNIGNANNRLVGYVGGAMLGRSASANHILQGGLPLTQAAGVTFLTPPSFAPVAAGTNFPLVVESRAEAGAELRLFYRRGGSPGPFSGPVAMAPGQGDEYSGTIPGTVIGIRGLEVYVEGIQNGVTTSLGSALSPIRVRSILQNQRSPSPPDAEFRMVGFPYDVDPNSVAAVFEDDLGAPDETQWKLGRWNDATSSYQEYGDVGAITRGHGYWLAVRHDKNYDASGLSALPTEMVGIQEYAGLVLRPGWNQISTPFGFNIDWNARSEPNPDQIGDALFDFAGGTGQYQLTTVMAPYRGYWVENTSNVDQALLLPYVENTAKAAGVAETEALAAADDNWRLGLELFTEDLRDGLLTVGVSARAATGRDALDYGQPPYPEGRYVALSSVLTAGDAGELHLAGDFRAPGNEGWRFTLLAQGNVAGAAGLRILPRSALPATYAVAVYDPATDRKYELSAENALVLPRALREQGSAYQLLVGVKSWVEQQEGRPEVMPTVFSLRQNYPNPFNPSTTIQFDLPTPSFVKLEVFDARGQRVATLANRPFAAGIHREQWLGQNDAGRQVASGLYFYRISSDDVVETRRMLLLK